MADCGYGMSGRICGGGMGGLSIWGRGVLIVEMKERYQDESRVREGEGSTRGRWAISCGNITGARRENEQGNNNCTQQQAEKRCMADHEACMIIISY